MRARQFLHYQSSASKQNTCSKLQKKCQQKVKVQDSNLSNKARELTQRCFGVQLHIKQHLFQFLLLLRYDFLAGIYVVNVARDHLLNVNYEYDKRNCLNMFKIVKTLERSQMTPLLYLLGFIRLRSSHLRCSMKKAVLKNFAIFTGEHLCWSFFLIKLQDFRPVTLLNETPTPILKKHLQMTASVNGKKI